MLDLIMLIKLSISLLLLILSLVALFTMFEIFGKSERRKNIDLLKKIHKINGRIFFIVFLAGSFLCIYLLSKSKTELNPRTSIHVFSAIVIFLLFSLKIIFIKYYREFYAYAKLLGIIIALLSFNLIAFSTGYSLIVGTFAKNTSSKAYLIITKSNQGDAEKGERLFENLCSSCHYKDKKDFKRGAPGLKGILQEKNLPVSKKPATEENVVNQIKKPYNSMPSFSDLTDEQIRDILAYLKAL